jgi:hypothetical protein
MLLPLPEVEDRVVSGQCWWVDGYGNAQTNVGPDELAAIGVAPGGEISVIIGASTHQLPWVNSYSDAPGGSALIHVDSSGLIAIAVNGGNAAEEFHLASGVTVKFAG